VPRSKRIERTDMTSIRPSARSVRLVAGGLAAALAAAAGGSQAAYDPGYLLVNKAANRCIDIWNGDKSDSPKIALFNCHGMTNQRWDIIQMGDVSHVMFRNRATGKCLEKRVYWYRFVHRYVGQGTCSASNGNQRWSVSWARTYPPHYLPTDFHGVWNHEYGSPKQPTLSTAGPNNGDSVLIEMVDGTEPKWDHRWWAFVR
jgi:hypothetical protein